MKLSFPIRAGFLLGLATTVALTGLLYLLAQVDLLSFIPLDVAEAIIQLTPGYVATQGIETLGANAKLLVEVGGIFLFLFVGTLAGVLLARLRAYKEVSNGLLPSLVGLILTVLVQMLAGHAVDIFTLVATAVLFFAWGLLLTFLLKRTLLPAPVAGQSVEAQETVTGRRAFLQQSSGILLGVALGSAGLGEMWRRAAEARLAEAIARGGVLALPGAPLSAPASQASEPSAGVGTAADPVFAPAPATRPELTSAAQLYVVSSSIRSPRVSAGQWRLTVKGLVDKPLSLSYDDMLNLPRIDQTSTLTCISNEVGGALIGNITWSGTRLRDLLQLAGARPEAARVVLRSVDNYSDSIPFDRAMSPIPLIAYGMDSITLTVDHGFPARLIVPGIYGMKNVKWLGEIEVVAGDYWGFWQERGWSNSAIVKTQTTVDTGNNALSLLQAVKLENGQALIGGYALAGDRGVSQVEVQVDGGNWQPARLKATLSPITWRPWAFAWLAAPGRHTLVVRATDGAGQLQTSDHAPPHPDGASGWHTVQVNVIL
ncbi:MAG: hypothetical protein EXR62_15985 [Chloroflexi bacterium]|nr:hypothetical protein [Chloroflexota bacterium]